MLKPTHERIGILTPLTILLLGYYYFDERISIVNMILLLIFSFLGSTFPDIDQRHSTGGQRFILLSICFSFWRFIGRKLKLKNIEKLMGHRGITHSLIIPIILYCTYFLLNEEFHFYYSVNYMVNGFFIGIMTHLIIDMFNPGGIPIFAPFSLMRVRLGKIKTGSPEEFLFRAFMTLALCVVILLIFVYRSDKFYDYLIMLTKPQTYIDLINAFWTWLGSLKIF